MTRFKSNSRSVCYGKQCPLLCSCVEREDGDAMRGAIELEIEGQRKKGRLNTDWLSLLIARLINRQDVVFDELRKFSTRQTQNGRSGWRKKA